jgi:hypothetical protein
MLNMKNKKHKYVVYFLVIIIIYIFFNRKEEKIFKIILKYKVQISIMVVLLLLFFYNSSNPLTRCNSSIKPVLKPFGNRGMFYNMDINSKYNKYTDESLYYGEFLDNVKEDEIQGKLINDQIIPKHHNFRNSTSLDRLLKLESEITLTNSKNEKYMDNNKNKFNLLQC